MLDGRSVYLSILEGAQLISLNLLHSGGGSTGLKLVKSYHR